MTELEAIQNSIKLWSWLAKTGREKEDWPGWEKFEYTWQNCFLCAYTQHLGDIDEDNCLKMCPYAKVYGICFEADKPFAQWEHCYSPEHKKTYAKLFLEQLKTLIHTSEDETEKNIAKLSRWIDKRVIARAIVEAVEEYEDLEVLERSKLIWLDVLENSLDDAIKNGIRHL